MKNALFCALILSSVAGVHVFAQPPRAARTLPPKLEVPALQLPDEKVQNALINLLLAVENADYQRFTKELTVNFRANVDEVLFKQIFDSLGTRMAPGYRVVYMGEINKPDYKTFVFKLVFKDKNGEVLTTISFNADAQGNVAGLAQDELKVAGFYLN